jgi:hypothetical protein
MTDEALSKDEAEATSSFSVHGKEASHGAATWQRQPKERPHCGGEREDTTPVGLTRILLSRKIKKLYYKMPLFKTPPMTHFYSGFSVRSLNRSSLLWPQQQ